METLKVRLLDNFPHDYVPLPGLEGFLEPAHEGDAGVDLYAAEDVVIPPGERRLVGTGIAIAVPPGLEAQVRPRSGNAAKLGLSIVNTPGTIDAGYRGEVKVILYNTNPVLSAAMLDQLYEVILSDEQADAGYRSQCWAKIKHDLDRNTIRVKAGDKIAQLVVAQFVRLPRDIVDDLDATSRGEGGFGSTGMGT